MNVLQVYQVFNPEAPSGAAKVAYDISRSLAKRGHRVVFYASDMEDWLTRGKCGSFNAEGIRIRRFKTIGTILSRKFKIYVTPSIIRTNSEIQRFDIIHLHGYRSFQSVVIHHYAKKHGVPYVLQAHGSIPRIMAKQSLKCVYDVLYGYKLLRDASKVIALNRVEAEQYVQMGVPDEKIAIIPNGIDLSEYAVLPPKGSFKKEFGIDDNEKIVLYLGRIHMIKGIDILVKAFANVIKKLDDVRLVIVGPDDGYLSYVKALIKTLKIEDNVLITGPLYGKDKLKAYIDAEVYVLPSRYETFPMTVLEAVICGTPVILTENCGIIEYFKDKSGLIVKPESNPLCEALGKLLLDTDKQNAFRKNCKTVAERFNISKTVPKIEKVYKVAAK